VVSPVPTLRLERIIFLLSRSRPDAAFFAFLLGFPFGGAAAPTVVGLP